MRNCKKHSTAFPSRLLGLILLFHTPVFGWAKDELPTVMLEGETPVLQLPQSLLKVLKVTFPGLRVPAKKDLRGEWLVYRGKEAVPYACWGDFNGDGLTDVALLLLGKDTWKLVAFHQTAKGTYVTFELDQFPGLEENFVRYYRPQEFHLSVLKAGSKHRVGDRLIEYPPHDFDCIDFFLLKDPKSGIHYEWASAPTSKDEEHRFKGFYTASTFGAIGD